MQKEAKGEEIEHHNLGLFLGEKSLQPLQDSFPSSLARAEINADPCPTSVKAWLGVSERGDIKLALGIRSLSLVQFKIWINFMDLNSSVYLVVLKSLL